MEIFQQLRTRYLLVLWDILSGGGLRVILLGEIVDHFFSE